VGSLSLKDKLALKYQAGHPRVLSSTAFVAGFDAAEVRFRDYARRFLDPNTNPQISATNHLDTIEMWLKKMNTPE